jgi:hypothetical protein
MTRMQKVTREQSRCDTRTVLLKLLYISCSFLGRGGDTLELILGTMSLCILLSRVWRAVQSMHLLTVALCIEVNPRCSFLFSAEGVILENGA